MYERLLEYVLRLKGVPRLPFIIFCSLLVATNFLVQWQVHLWRLTFTVGLALYPLTFLLTDFVNEIHGKPVAKRMVYGGFLFSVLPSLLVSTPRITLGSLLAYLLAQLLDVSSYNWWRVRTKGRFLWLRSNASGFISLLVDTLVFTSVSFYGVLDNRTVLSIMYSEYPVKVAYSLANTIPLYAMVALAKRHSVKKESG
ncbi:MAG: queuosine precursor transporter [Armatimonadota bacterium]